MNGAYGYWVGAVDGVRVSASVADLEVYESHLLSLWERWWCELC